MIVIPQHRTGRAVAEIRVNAISMAAALLLALLGVAGLGTAVPAHASGDAGAAVGSQHPRATPRLDSATPGGRTRAASTKTCPNDKTYPTPMYLVNIYHVVNGGTLATSWNSEVSPYQLYIQDENTPTAYCFYENGRGYYTLQQYGLQRCLYLQTSNRTITEGDCSSNYALWQIHFHSYQDVSAWIVESRYQSSGDPCIYQGALNGLATYDPCDNSNTGDLWAFYDAN